MSREAWYALVLILALVIVRATKLDHDPGPAPGQHYPRFDAWSWWHLVGSLLLALTATLVRVEPWWAFGLTLAAGVGWEFVNGHVDRWDIVWDAAGSGVGAGLGALVLRLVG